MPSHVRRIVRKQQADIKIVRVTIGTYEMQVKYEIEIVDRKIVRE